MDKTIKTIPSYEVAKMMGKEHWEVLRMLEGSKDRKGIIEVLEDDPQLVVVDYFIMSTYDDAKGETRKCYECTKLGCDMLANKMTGEKGILFTAKYVKKFNEMENSLQQQLPSYQIEDPIERAERWIEEEKERRKLQQENKIMMPKASYFDALVERNLLTNFRDTAKEFKIGQKELIEWLIDNDYIYRDNKGKLKPYMKYVDAGLFEIKEYKKNKHAGTQTLIAPKGRETFKLLIGVK